MAGYVIADIEVTNQAQYDEYRKLAGPTVEKYGGRYMIRGGDAKTLEGDWSPNRLIVLQFDSVERAREWYDSEEYKHPKSLRMGSSKGNVIIAEGA